MARNWRKILAADMRLEASRLEDEAKISEKADDVLERQANEPPRPAVIRTIIESDKRHGS
jgi:hypothetical protein